MHPGVWLLVCSLALPPLRGPAAGCSAKARIAGSCAQHAQHRDYPGRFADPRHAQRSLDARLGEQGIRFEKQKGTNGALAGEGPETEDLGGRGTGDRGQEMEDGGRGMRTFQRRGRVARGAGMRPRLVTGEPLP